MKYDNTRAFEKHLHASAPQHFADVYLILCADAARSEEAIALIISSIIGKRTQEAVHSFDGEESDVDAILDELNTYPLFSKQKIILVRRADRLKKQGVKALEPYLQRPNPRVTCILSMSALAPNTRAYKNAQQSGVILSLAAQKPWERQKELTEWLYRRLEKEGKRAEAKAVQALARASGGDQGILHQELDKLICYAKERELITAEDVAAVGINAAEETVWQLAEALFSREAKEALASCQRLFLIGHSLTALLSQLRSQVRTLMLIHAVLASSGRPEDITKHLPYLKGQILQKKCQTAQRFGPARCRAALLAIDEADRLMRNSAAEPEILLLRLVMQLVRD